MNKNQIMLMLGMFFIMGVFLIMPEMSFAQYGGGDFQSKIGSVTRSLVDVLIPAVSILGLAYAAILAATGDAEAKSRMVLIAIASIVAFLAPMIIHWLQRISSGY